MFNLAAAVKGAKHVAIRRTPRAPTDPRSAVLRWRTRWLLSTLHPRTRLAARLLPVLLQTSIERPELRAEPPGVEGMKTRLGWANLARSFGLPPPRSGQRGRRLVSAVLALPGERLRLMVLPTSDLGEREAETLRVRLHAARSVLLSAGVELELLVAPYPPELLFFGALLAGQLNAHFWADIDLSASDVLQQRQVIELAAAAPTPLSSLLCLLLANRSTTAPATVLKQELATGTSARALSDPEYLLYRWAAAATPYGEHVKHALAVGAARPSTRQWVRTDPIEPGPEDLIRDGRTLFVAAARAIRTFPLRERRPLLDRLRRESMVGLPIFFIQHLTGRMSSSLAAPVRAGPRRVEIRDSAGTLLSAAANTEQAVARALSLLCAVRGDSRVALKGVWERVLPKLELKVERRTVVTMPLPRLNPASPIEYALWLLLRPGTRPSARIVRAPHLLPLVLRELSISSTVEVIGATNDLDPATNRLDRTVVQVGAALRLGNALALHDQERVLCLKQQRVLRIKLDRYLARPRSDVFISVDPTQTHPSAFGRRWTSPTIECQISALDRERAALVYLDGQGKHFREIVPLRHLEPHVRDAQQLLRQLPVPGLLAIRASTEVAALAGRVSDDPTFLLEVRGHLPLGVQVRVGEEDFGPGARYGLEAVAQQILSQWPPGVTGRIGIQKSVLTGAAGLSPSLYALYVRSLVLRRLYAYLRRLT